MHKISVAIITSNRSALLYQCLLSLRNQHRPPDEVVIVDNASRDSTKQVVEKFATLLPLQYIFSPHRGYSANRLMAMNRTKFNTIAWIDDDCLAPTNWLQEIEKSLEIGMYLFQGVDVDAGLNVYSYAQNLRTEECRIFFQKLRNDYIYVDNKRARKIYKTKKAMKFSTINSVDHRCFVYRKEILRRLPYIFDTRLPAYFCADEWDILRRIRNAGYSVVLNPRIKVIHMGRATLKGFLRRQLEYGKNDAIRQWIDNKRRKKTQKIKKLVSSPQERRFFYTNKLFLMTDILLVRKIWGKNLSTNFKVTTLLLFLLGKVVRTLGRIHESVTNTQLRQSYTLPQSNPLETL